LSLQARGENPPRQNSTPTLNSKRCTKSQDGVFPRAYSTTAPMTLTRAEEVTFVLALEAGTISTKMHRGDDRHRVEPLLLWPMTTMTVLASPLPLRGRPLTAGRIFLVAALGAQHHSLLRRVQPALQRYSVHE